MSSSFPFDGSVSRFASPIFVLRGLRYFLLGALLVFILSACNEKEPSQQAQASAVDVNDTANSKKAESIKNSTSSVEGSPLLAEETSQIASTVSSTNGVSIEKKSTTSSQQSSSSVQKPTLVEKSVTTPKPPTTQKTTTTEGKQVSTRRTQASTASTSSDACPTDWCAQDVPLQAIIYDGCYGTHYADKPIKREYREEMTCDDGSNYIIVKGKKILTKSAYNMTDQFDKHPESMPLHARVDVQVIEVWHNPKRYTLFCEECGVTVVWSPW